jgi:UDP-N-acetylglucosamine 2-epimerase (non-hydrolysing)
MMHMEKILEKEASPLVLVEGDTNAVLATALAAVKLAVPVGHVEAGLRSFDLRMPEEHNRRLTDHISTLLYAPTTTSRNNLEQENVWGKIFITGNTVIDAVIQHLPIAESKSRIMQKIPFKEFALATAHRAENVDDITVLKDFIDAFHEAPIPVVYPMHPRTRKRLKHNAITIENSNIHVLPPLGYFDFLVLMKNCRLIVTDSGGIQEEATAPCIRKPVVVIRNSTERPEAVAAGFAKIAGTQKPRILEAMEATLKNAGQLPLTSPYGDGDAAEKICTTLENVGFG